MDRRNNVARNIGSNDSPAQLENAGLRKASSDVSNGNLSFRALSHNDIDTNLHFYRGGQSKMFPSHLNGRKDMARIHNNLELIPR